MGNIFEDFSIPALIEVLTTQVGNKVQYIHAGSTYEIDATRGSLNFGTLNKLGDVALQENYRDYIIKASVIGFEPTNGDRIVDGSDTFEVFNNSGSNTCWRYSDPCKQIIRIYTRRIAK